MNKFLAGFTAAYLLDPTSTLVTYLVEWAKSAISVKIAKNNAKIQQLTPQQEEEIQTHINAIGFAIPSEEGDYVDEE